MKGTGWSGKTQSSNNRPAWWKKMKSTLGPCWQVKPRTTESFNNSEGLGAAGRVQAKDSNVRCQRRRRFPGAPDSIRTCRHLACLDLAWLVLACLDSFDLTNLPWIAWLELFGLTYLPLLSWPTWLDLIWLDLTWLSWLAWLELFGLTYLPLLSWLTWLDLTWLAWLDLLNLSYIWKYCKLRLNVLQIISNIPKLSKCLDGALVRKMLAKLQHFRRIMRVTW